jgi:hypothetical protein
MADDSNEPRDLGRHLYDLRNHAEGLIWTTEKVIEELSIPMPARIGRAIAEASEAMESDSPKVLNAAIQRLEAEAYPLAELLYEQRNYRTWNPDSPIKAKAQLGSALKAGHLWCTDCGGSGVCLGCDGFGYDGRDACRRCSGDKLCAKCQGHGQMKLE